MDFYSSGAQLDFGLFREWALAHREIWLFGAGKYGRAVRQCLLERGIRVSGFIVTAPESALAESGEPIVAIEDFRESIFSKNSVVMLAVDCKYYNEFLPRMSFAINNIHFLEESFKRRCLEQQEKKCKPENPYDAEFYDFVLASQLASADELLKAITTFISPRSVVDVGCGVGLIASKFKNYGAKEVFGIDGDYIDKSRLKLDVECFISHDLTTPYESERRYDLAISLEVAEHLDECYAEQFVEMLCNLSDVVVFSASVPGQGGVKHINEKPQSYWAELFAKNGYNVIDCVRPLIWNKDQVDFWYKQNMFFYVNSSSNIHAFANYVQQPILDIIHPSLFELYG